MILTVFAFDFFTTYSAVGKEYLIFLFKNGDFDPHGFIYSSSSEFSANEFYIKKIRIFAFLHLS